jgi:hypothetical protein
MSGGGGGQRRAPTAKKRAGSAQMVTGCGRVWVDGFVCALALTFLGSLYSLGRNEEDDDDDDDN